MISRKKDNKKPLKLPHAEDIKKVERRVKSCPKIAALNPSMFLSMQKSRMSKIPPAQD